MTGLRRSRRIRFLLALAGACGCAYLALLASAIGFGFRLGLSEDVLIGRGIPMTASYSADPPLPHAKPLDGALALQAALDAGVQPAAADQAVLVAPAAPGGAAPAPNAVPSATPAVAAPGPSPTPQVSPSPSAATAARGSMVGTATSAVTHRGISGASVTVYGVGTVTTDQYGDYRIAGLAPSTVYSVVCSAPGFSTQDAQVSSDSAGNAWLDIQLMPTVPGSQTSP